MKTTLKLEKFDKIPMSVISINEGSKLIIEKDNVSSCTFEVDSNLTISGSNCFYVGEFNPTEDSDVSNKLKKDKGSLVKIRFDADDFD